jgi:glucosyl-3-phosphoglycerate synthase
VARTHHWSDWTLTDLLAAKEAAGSTVSLVVPARNEAATVGDVVTRVREALVDTTALLDEVVVIDSDSTDATSTVAADAGARVFGAADIRPDLGTFPGKGEAMWKSQFVTHGDLVVFMDADLVDWDTHFVPGLLGPLLTDPEVQLVKGYYERPFRDADHPEAAYEGGRVTELVARPLLALHRPDLGGLVQPLAGEWAVRREHLASLSVPTGYAVEIAALIDTFDRAGLGAIAQVDLGRRAHRHQALLDLGRMAAQLTAAVARRSGLAAPPDVLPLTQFVPGPGRADGTSDPVADVHAVDVRERPPAASLGEGGRLSP